MEWSRAPGTNEEQQLPRPQDAGRELSGRALDGGISLTLSARGTGAWETPSPPNPETFSKVPPRRTTSTAISLNGSCWQACLPQPGPSTGLCWAFPGERSGPERPPLPRLPRQRPHLPSGAPRTRCSKGPRCVRCSVQNVPANVGPGAQGADTPPGLVDTTTCPRRRELRKTGAPDLA